MMYINTSYKSLEAENANYYAFLTIVLNGQFMQHFYQKGWLWSLSLFIAWTAGRKSVWLTQAHQLLPMHPLSASAEQRNALNGIHLSR